MTRCSRARVYAAQEKALNINVPVTYTGLLRSRVIGLPEGNQDPMQRASVSRLSDQLVHVEISCVDYSHTRVNPTLLHVHYRAACCMHALRSMVLISTQRVHCRDHIIRFAEVMVGRHPHHPRLASPSLHLQSQLACSGHQF